MKKLKIKIFKIGDFTAELLRVNAPLSISSLMKEIPIKGKALRQDNALVMPTDIVVRSEKPRTEFSSGDISIDPSSGNLTFHIDSGKIRNGENYLGHIVEELIVDDLPISTGILIKEYSEEQ